MTTDQQEPRNDDKDSSFSSGMNDEELNAALAYLLSLPEDERKLVAWRVLMSGGSWRKRTG